MKDETRLRHDGARVAWTALHVPMSKKVSEKAKPESYQSALAQFCSSALRADAKKKATKAPLASAVKKRASASAVGSARLLHPFVSPCLLLLRPDFTSPFPLRFPGMRSNGLCSENPGGAARSRGRKLCLYLVERCERVGCATGVQRIWSIIIWNGCATDLLRLCNGCA